MTTYKTTDGKLLVKAIGAPRAMVRHDGVTVYQVEGFRWVQSRRDWSSNALTYTVNPTQQEA